MLTGNKEGVMQVNVHAHVAPATLEAIGEGSCDDTREPSFHTHHPTSIAAFDYKLGVLEDEASELGRAYSNLV